MKTFAINGKSAEFSQEFYNKFTKFPQEYQKNHENYYGIHVKIRVIVKNNDTKIQK